MALMHLQAHAELVGGIDYPRVIGHFQLRSVIDNEKRTSGHGVSLLYNAPGVKASVFVYDLSERNIPEGIGSSVVRREFAHARSDVQQTYSDVQILVREKQSSVGGVALLQSDFRYIEIKQDSRDAVLSHLYFTARKGNFIKVRVTYSADNHPELGRRTHLKFIEDLCKILAE